MIGDSPETARDARRWAAALCSCSAVFRGRGRPIEISGTDSEASESRCEGRHMIAEEL